VARKQKRLFYLGLTAAIVVLFAAGVISGYVGRHSSLCSDGKPPVQQQDVGIGQVEYLCHNGKIVTK